MSTTSAWYDNDQFWTTWAPMMFRSEAWEIAPQQVDQILALMQPPPGGAILDLACGPGRHSLELARRGFAVTGVDRTQAYLDQARARAQSENLRVELVHCDMRQFIRPAAFDASICFFTSFGYFESIEDDQQVLANLHSSLKPGGKLLVEMMGKETLAARFRPREWSEEAGVIRLEERQIIDDWSRIRTRWIKLDGDSREEFTFAHRVYSAIEMRAAMKSAGFGAVTIFGAVDGIPYDHNARRLVALAEK